MSLVNLIISLSDIVSIMYSMEHCVLWKCLSLWYEYLSQFVKKCSVVSSCWGHASQYGGVPGNRLFSLAAK